MVMLVNSRYFFKVRSICFQLVNLVDQKVEDKNEKESVIAMSYSYAV